MIKTKIVSSLEKAFLDQNINDFKALNEISALKGERLSFQLIYLYESDNSPEMKYPKRILPEIKGELKEYLNVTQVCFVPVSKAVTSMGADDNFLRTTPGLYPDLLKPMTFGGKVSFVKDVLNAVWIEINIPKDIKAGEYSLEFSFDGEEFGKSESSIKIEIIDAVLPEEDIIFTQWFHTDCLANYYNVPVWSERHWKIIESFAKTARRNGINMLLTPVFTPPLDTEIGGERLTTQLVDVKKTEIGYEFGFSKLDRWIDMCNRCDIKYFEISHFFTQWGAKHAPKVMAEVNGEYKRIFGWETEATGTEYVTFLQSFLKELLSHLKKRGDDKRCYFHVSDEPNAECFESYKNAKAVVSEILKGYPVMDALSDFEFYKTEVVSNPIPATDSIMPFIENGVKDLWAYYCIVQVKKVSNRFCAMPSWRNRSIGMQLYKYGIKGFLHWGYNFYSNNDSANPINPYLDQSVDYVFPAGEAYSVYPETDGTALETIRLKVFYDALQDIKAMKLAEKLTSKDEVVKAIEAAFEKEITFETCAKTAEKMLLIRETVNEIIKKRVS